MDLQNLIGKSLDNRFELKKLIGQGGYGAVFEAVQTSMQRRCAVKVLSISTDDPKQVARFELEARLTCRLSHPNTIVVYEYGRDPILGVFFIAMEYLDGVSLRELANSKKLSLEETLHILKQTASSLDDAHTYDLVHRDVKPHNIMIVKRGGDSLSVKVIDFGIAKSQDEGLDLTQTDTIIGTPEYMSTEQVLNRKLSGKTDQYALAVTAYYLLTGRTVFKCDTALQTAVAHAQETPQPLSALTDRFLEMDNFDAVLLKALSKSPDDRFDTCEAFVDALEKHKPKVKTIVAGVAPPRNKLSTTEFEHAVARTEIGIDAAEKASVEVKATPVPISQTAGIGASSLNIDLNTQEAKKANKRMMWGVIVFVSAALIFGGVFFVIKDTIKETLSKPTKEEVVKKEAPIVPEKKPPKKTIPEKIVEEVKNEEKLTPTVPDKSTKATIKAASSRKEKERLERERKKKILDALNKEKVEKAKAEKAKKAKAEKAKAEKEKKELLKNTEVAVGKMGRVKIVVVPWGAVYIDGKKMGTKSRYSLQLKEGKHVFTLKQNGVTKAVKYVKIRSSKVTKIRLSPN